MPVTKTTHLLTRNATVQSAAPAQQLPKPPAQKKGLFSGLLKNKKVACLASDPLAAPNEKKGFFAKLFKPNPVAAPASNPPAAQEKAVEAPKVEASKAKPKAFNLDSLTVAQDLLKDTSRSTFDKLKSLLPIPDSLAPYVKMFLGKGTNANVKVGIENGTLRLTTDVKAPGAGIRGTAVLSLPISAKQENSLTEIHPVIVDKLNQVLNPLLSEEQQVKAVIKLLSTLPSEVLKFHWSNGSADIIITLPNGASLTLNLTIQGSEKTPDILRTYLKSILKENYAGLETFLSKDMIFNWDGSTSRFEIRFPQQLSLHIEEISSIDIANPILRKLVAAVAKDSTLIIPPNIRGTVDFKNPSIQFDKGTTFLVNNAPLPDITIDRLAYDPSTKKMFLTLKTSWALFPDALLKDLEIDLKDSPKKAPKRDAVENPTIVKYAFVPVATQEADRPETQAAVEPKPTISVFESLQKMVKIPDALKILFANQTKLDMNIGIEDDLTIAVNNINIPKLGVTGTASLKIPTKPTEEKEPVTLPREIEEIIEKLGGKNLQPDSLEEFALITNLTDLALTLPNQTIRMQWEGNMSKATLFITLPGGMELTLELDVKNIPAEHDMLRTKLLEVLDSELVIPEEESAIYYLHTKLLAVLDTAGANDPRRALIRETLRTNPDKDALREKLLNMPGTDFLRTKLSEVLGDQFSEIEPFLSQTMSFKWDGDKAVLELPKMGVIGQASLSFQKPAAAHDKKTVELHPKIKDALRDLMTADAKSDPMNLIDLMMTMSNQQITLAWTGNKATLFVTLPGNMLLNLELDLQMQGKKDILRMQLEKILGSQFAADIEPLLAQTFTFSWNGENKKFSLAFHKEQNLHIKSLRFKKAVGRFASIKNLFMKIGEWLTKNRMITLPKEIHGDVDFKNAKINFRKGTSFFIRTILGTKRAGLRLISFARENMLDIGIKCMGGHIIDIDRRTSNIDIARTQIAIVDKA